MAAPWKGIVRKIDDYRWEIPTSYKAGMMVPGLIFASESMLGHIWQEQAFQQVANVAFLPGIVRNSLAMPDIHWGYGFPIGGVAATRVRDGVVSPGGVGFDINCGVRLVRTSLTEDEVRPKISELVNRLFVDIPSGLGSEGKIRVKEKELEEVTEVVIRVGELQQVDPDVLKFALDQLRSSVMKETKFILEFIQAKLRCQVCDNEWGYNSGRLKEDASEAIHFVPEMAHVCINCPNCGSPDFKVEDGRGLLIAKIKGVRRDAGPAS